MDSRSHHKRQLTGSTPGLRWAVALTTVLFVAAGVSVWFLQRARVARGLELSRTEFPSLPGWKATDPTGALAALQRSCAILLRFTADRTMGGSGYAGTAGDWHGVCTSLPLSRDGNAVRSWFETRFVPFAVSAGEDPVALFTGYYEPEIRASRTRHDMYATPVYGPPRDLLTADLGQFRKGLTGIRISGHAINAHFVPFPPRAEIDASGLPDAAVLLYADDPIAVFFLHIQGSGRARLEDGSMLRLSYAAQNGRPYTPIGRVLIEKGDLDRAHMSMQAIRDWLHAHPQEADAVMESDASYVFFRELPIGDPRLGSPGTEGVPLTPEASIAVDPSLHALGAPMYVAADAPVDDVHRKAQTFARLCVAQDTGGAIKGAARADIFWGFGPRAEAVAGRLKSRGRLYVLLPESLAARIGARFQAK